MIELIYDGQINSKIKIVNNVRKKRSKSNFFELNNRGKSHGGGEHMQQLKEK